ncbi:MAG TPA: hypothetical protein PKD78_10285 [Saprospiraceae bacterium]|nr:hypothetical protein [Saprospiraceae bacterium]HNG90089.1 hypothetical protein [Saprospiraceae bacterium]
MTILKRLLSFLPFLLATHCTLNVNHLTGSWRAIGFYEEGHSIDTPLDSVLLWLEPGQQRYRFRSIGYYHEAGRLRVQDQLLYLTDTTVSPQQLRTVQVLFLSPDTLKLQMADNGREQVLFLAR